MKKLIVLLALLLGCATAKPTAQLLVPPPLLPMFSSEPAAPQTPCTKDGACVFKLSGDVDDEMATSLATWLRLAAASTKDVTIEINSPGGEVEAGWDIIDSIRDSGLTTHCKVTRTAASMAAVILQACSTREMTKSSRIMHHEAAGGGLISGRKELYRNLSEDLRTLSRTMAEYAVRRMKITVEVYEAHTSGGLDWWITWDEALAVGAVDSVVD
jgi:ATP-dependent Clp protease protease subunit